jgi:Phosphodiester glycosidase
MASVPVRSGRAGRLGQSLLVLVAVALASCSSGSSTAGTGTPTSQAREHSSTTAPGRSATTVPSRTPSPATGGPGTPLPVPTALPPFNAVATPGEGSWHPAGRLVRGFPAVYETTLVPPNGSQPAGVAWMDTHLLSAQLYSGSKSPGGGPYLYTAPIESAQAASLVAAFNGGFLMDAAGGGYFTEGRVVVPLVTAAASLVIHANGTVDVGAWGSEVSMTSDVASVRQNLVPLVEGGQPTAQAAGPDWLSWGSTCGATSCAATVPGIEHQWRSGVGVTADGALVYATGPLLTPLQLAQLLVRAGVVRGMELDINPTWTFLVTYDPIDPGGLAAPGNGARLLAGTMQGPATLFDPAWARDFVTMSGRTSPTD